MAKTGSGKLEYDLAREYLRLIGLEKLASIVEDAEITYDPPAPNVVAVIEISVKKVKTPFIKLKPSPYKLRPKATIRLIYGEILENIHIDAQYIMNYTDGPEKLCYYEETVNVQLREISKDVDEKLYYILYDLYKTFLEQYAVALHITRDQYLGLIGAVCNIGKAQMQLVSVSSPSKPLAFAVLLNPLEDTVKVLIESVKEDEETIIYTDDISVEKSGKGYEKILPGSMSNINIGLINAVEYTLAPLITDKIEEYCSIEEKQFKWILKPFIIEVVYKTSEALNDIMKSREVIKRIRLFETSMNRENILKALKRIRKMKPLWYGESLLTNAVTRLLDCEIATLEHYLFGRRYHRPGDPSSLLKTLVKILEHYYNTGYIRVGENANPLSIPKGNIAYNETIYVVMNYLLKILLPFRALVYGKKAPLPLILASIYSEVDLIKMVAGKAVLDKENLLIGIDGVEIPVSDQFIEYLSSLKKANPLSEYLTGEAGQ